MKEYNFKINGNDYNVSIQDVKNGMAEVSVNGVPYAVEITGDSAKPSIPNKPQISPVPASHAVQPTAIKMGQPAKVTPAASDTVIKSPLPGVILQLNVKEGDTVSVGQSLLVLEAMKMENNIDSIKAGTVKSIKVSKGDSVLEGDVLLIIG